jgi:hypothetical protein
VVPATRSLIVHDTTTNQEVTGFATLHCKRKIPGRRLRFREHHAVMTTRCQPPPTPSMRLAATRALLPTCWRGGAAAVTSDFVSFSRSKGVYGGLNLYGNVISVNND